MIEPSDAASLRATLSAFDDRQKKIAGGMISVMIQSPERVRDREWIAEQFTHMVLLAGNFEGIEGAHQGAGIVQTYVQENIGPLLNACFELFQRVAEDMAELEQSERNTERAVAQALSYF